MCMRQATRCRHPGGWSHHEHTRLIPKPCFCSGSGTKTGVLTTPWTLTTKYYDADLEVHLLPSEEFIEPTAVSRQSLTGAEALILLLDATSEDALAQAAPWAELAAEFQPPCVLCCINKADIASGIVPGAADQEGTSFPNYGSDGSAAGAGSASSAPPATATAAEPSKAYLDMLARAQDWCLDHGFEMVETSAIHPLVGASARDKTSVARVYEALQSNMWANMRRRAPAANASYGGSGKGLFGGLTLASTAPADTDNEATNGADADNAADDNTDSGSGMIASMRREVQARADGGSEEAAIADTDVTAGDDGGDAIGLGGSATSDSGPDIGVMMEEMRRVRDRARQPGVTDDERRDAAAAMAMRLMAMMGALGGDEEEEEEDDVDKA